MPNGCWRRDRKRAEWNRRSRVPQGVRFDSRRSHRPPAGLLDREALRLLCFRAPDVATTLAREMRMPLHAGYSFSLVLVSILIASAASYTALDLAGRVTAARGRERLAWLAGGSLAMGVGIWSMHFVGMLAFHLPVPITYQLEPGAALGARGAGRLRAGAGSGEPAQRGAGRPRRRRVVHGAGHRRHALHRDGRAQRPRGAPVGLPPGGGLRAIAIAASFVGLALAYAAPAG